MSEHPNRITWFEIPVTDLERSAALYSAALRLEMKREVFFGIPHAIFLADGAAVTGTLICDPRRTPRQGVGTVVYLRAADGVAAALARAVRAGAKVVQPATEIGPFGTIALIEDFDGNVVGLHTPKSAAA
jgi:predicted enzyme related to lactoylglutathione lyase